MKECVWPDECQPACKGCVRMEELLSEREAGFIEGLGEGARLRGDLLLPMRTDGIISEDMRMATNLSLGKATAGSLIKFLTASPPNCPVTVSPDGVFLVVLNTPA
jgi:hypothetical protein